MKKTAICLTMLAATLAFSISVNGQPQGKQTEQVIIFVCEHGAAKSILSAAIFNKLAAEQGVNLRAIARGTNPDPEISPKVARGLQEDGLVTSEPAPKKISNADLNGARRVITLTLGTATAARQLRRACRRFDSETASRGCSCRR